MITTAAVIVACTIGATEYTQILEFTSQSCGPCRQMAATVERLNQDGYKIQQIDVNDRPDLADAFAVRQIPCFLIVRDHQVVDQLVGTASYQELAQFCQQSQHIAATASDSIVRGQVDQSQAGGTILDRLRNRGLLPGSDARPIGNPFARRTEIDHAEAEDSCQCATATVDVAPPNSIGPPTVIAGSASSRGPVHPDFTDGPPQRQAFPLPMSAPPNLPTAQVSPSNFVGAAPVASSTLVNTSPAGDSAMKNALQATVRLRIEDDQGQSFGTGTVIDVHQDEALVLTCGHIFRAGKGVGRITCDFFAEGGAPAEGKLVCYDIRRDVGLVSVRPNIKITPMKVGGNGEQPERGDHVFAVGCNHGEAPTINTNQILAVNRYHGPANLVVGGRPVDGRSGGGLFTTDGILIGVCNAADQKDDEGLYAALGPIHAELDRAGLAFIYQPQSPLLASSRASTTGVSPSRFVSNGPSEAVKTVSEIPAFRQNSPQQNDRSTDVGSVTPDPLHSDYSDPQSTANPTASREELICIVRSLDGGSAENRVFVIEHPSSDLVQQLSSEINKRGQHESTGMQIPTRTRVPVRSQGRW